jgi:hypothetical protein
VVWFFRKKKNSFGEVGAELVLEQFIRNRFGPPRARSDGDSPLPAAEPSDDAAV